MLGANLMGVAWGQKYSLFTGEKPKEKKIKAKSVPLIQLNILCIEKAIDHWRFGRRPPWKDTSSFTERIGALHPCGFLRSRSRSE